MEFLGDILTHPFTLGLLLGLVFAALAWFKSLRLQSQLNKQMRMMGEKIAIEHDNWSTLRADNERLKQENENLRLKIADLNRSPDRRAMRDLEIVARAAQKMVQSAPGFASAWESAKTQSLEELELEERGKSLTRRLYEGLVRKKPSAVPPAPTNLTIESGAPPQ